MWGNDISINFTQLGKNMGKLLLWLHLLPWVKGFKVDSLIIFISLAKVTTISIRVKRYFDPIIQAWQKCGKVMF